MAKRIEMTRARQQALPVILEAARAHLAAHSGGGRKERELEAALEAFGDNPAS